MVSKHPLGRPRKTLFLSWRAHIEWEVPYDPRSALIFFRNFSDTLHMARSPSKTRAPFTICENKNFRVQVCVTHGWKGLEERNKLWKRTHVLKLILEGLILILKSFKSHFQCVADSLNVVQCALEWSYVDERPIKMYVRIFYTLLKKLDSKKTALLGVRGLSHSWSRKWQ